MIVKLLLTEAALVQHLIWGVYQGYIWWGQFIELNLEIPNLNGLGWVTTIRDSHVISLGRHEIGQWIMQRIAIMWGQNWMQERTLHMQEGGAWVYMKLQLVQMNV